MPTNNFIVSSLPAYVQENRDMLLKNFGLVGTDTRRRISLQTGVKKSAYLNYIEVDPTLQDGSACGFSEAGDVTLTQQTIETAMIKVNFEICPKKLVGKYAEYLVRIAATEDDLPFERWIVDGLMASINKKIEKLIWLGDKSQTSDTDLKWIDGFLELASDASVTDVEIASGSSAYAGIMAVYAAMPEEAIERGGVIHVSPAIYRAFLMDLTAANLYHYSGPQDAAPDEFVLPGTNVRVVKTPGLAGSLKILGSWDGNLVYGTDFEGNEEDIKIWFSDDDDVFKVKVLWNSGVQFYFPNYVVTGTFAAAPGMPSTSSGEELQDIATGVAGIKTNLDTMKTDLGTMKTDLGTIATKSAGLDNLAGIKTGTDHLANIDTAVTGLNAADKVFKTQEQQG